ncbi:UNVERIFIED_CONTAM: hypothetical protein Sradi_0488700 [Sesamum radiatum]|uniref:Uncharacterized protein n=1 Tax=Sesamum radiatum TaxID=300843 RepID=A0AAW2W8L5_SESRA
MSTITFTDEDLLLGSKPHNRPLFVVGYVREQKVNRILIDGGSAVNILPLRILKEIEIPIDELSNSRLMIQGFNQGGQWVVGIIRMQLTMEDMVSTLLFHVIDAKTSYNMLLDRPCKPFTEAEAHFADVKYYIEGDKKVKEVSPSEEPKSCEGEGHEALAIDEEGFYPKAFNLLVKAGYNPKEKLSLRKLPPKATGKRLHGLNATQIMLKEKGHAIQDSRVSLGFTPPKPVRIAIRRVSSNYVVEGFSSTEDDEGKENPRESVFNRLGPHGKVLHGIANKQSFFDRLGPRQRMWYQKKGMFKTTLAISCGEVLKVKAQTMIFTQVQSDDEDERESVASSNYISNGVEEDIVQTYHVTLIEDGEIEVKMLKMLLENSRRVLKPSLIN